MSVDLATRDVEASALAKLPGYLNRQRRREYLEVFASELQELDDAIVAVCDQLHLDNAADAMLDLIGSRVGQPRAGMEDAAYRTAIRGRVAVQRSQGLSENIIDLARKILDSEGSDATIELRGTGIASACLTLPSATGVDPAVAASVTGFARLAISGGVRLLVVSSEAPDASTFRFAAGVGTQPTLDLTTLTSSAFDTVLGAKLYGLPAYDVVRLSIIADAGAPNPGAWAAGFPAFVFHIKDGVTTIADFEAAVASGQSDYLEVLTASTSPGAFVDPAGTFADAHFVGGEDDYDEPGAGFDGTPPTIALAALCGSGFTTIIGLRAFGTAANAGHVFSFVPDAGAPAGGSFAGTAADYEFHFQPGVTTILDFEHQIDEDDSEVIYLVSASGVAGAIVDPGDAFTDEPFVDAIGGPGGVFANVQE